MNFIFPFINTYFNHYYRLIYYLDEGDVVVESTGGVVLVHFVAFDGEVLLFSAVHAQLVLAHGDAENANTISINILYHHIYNVNQSKS